MAGTRKKNLLRLRLVNQLRRYLLFPTGYTQPAAVSTKSVDPLLRRQF
jgi:hypothetical protein